MMASLATLALARPEAGYSYNAPSSSGATSLSFGSSAGYVSGSSGGSVGYAASAPLSSAGYSGSSGAGYSSISSAGYSGSSSAGYSGGYNYAAAPVVQKHIYVHVPPAEQEYVAPPQIQQVAPPQKHYKIIFIKAPTPPTPTVPILPQIQQDSEKTLIYVLVKKPEDQPQITIPTPAPTTPSKPEVYFIKYKTQKESGGYSSASGAGFSGASGAGFSGASGAGYSGVSAAGFSGSSESAGHSAVSLASSAPGSSYGVPSSSGSY